MALELAVLKLLNQALAREPWNGAVCTHEQLTIVDFNIDFLTFNERGFDGKAGRDANGKAVTPSLDNWNRHTYLLRINSLL